MSAPQRLQTVLCVCGHPQNEHNHLGNEKCGYVELVNGRWFVCDCRRFLPR